MSSTLGAPGNGSQADYRKRYLDLLDERDRARLDCDERIVEVATLLARLARAVTAAGDAQLARRIQELCDGLRARPMDPALGRRLRSLHQELLGFMEGRERETWALVQNLCLAADQLESLAPSRRLRGALKRFRKQLKAGGVGTASLMEELVAIQEKVVAELARVPGERCGDSPDVEPCAISADSTGDGGPGGARERTQVAADGAGEVDWDVVRDVLASMLDALTLPASERRQAQALRDLLTGDLSEAVLLQALGSLGSLTDAALLALRGEFSGFLDGVDRRLDELLGALAGAHESGRTDRLRRRELTGQMREHLSTLRSRARESDDLDELKSSIDDHLQRLVDTLSGLSGRDEQDDSAAEAQLERMRERLVLLESESAEARRQLQTQRRLAHTDPLTGIANRLGFDELATAVMDAAGSAPVSLAMVDIDHFKRVNDHFGHPAGDRALCLVANVLRSRIRATDVCARFGGEEFVVLFTGADAAVAARVMNQVRALLSECGVNHQGRHIELSASFGVTQFIDGESLDSVIARADQALYEAKNGGRNRVVTR